MINKDRYRYACIFVTLPQSPKYQCMKKIIFQLQLGPTHAQGAENMKKKTSKGEYELRCTQQAS